MEEWNDGILGYGEIDVKHAEHEHSPRNSKFQASNIKHHAKGRQESQIPNTNDLNYYRFVI